MNPYYVHTYQFIEGALARGALVDLEFEKVSQAFDTIDANLIANYLTEPQTRALISSLVTAGGTPSNVPLADFNNTGLANYQLLTKLPASAAGAVVDKINPSVLSPFLDAGNFRNNGLNPFEVATRFFGDAVGAATRKTNLNNGNAITYAAVAAFQNSR